MKRKSRENRLFAIQDLLEKDLDKITLREKDDARSALKDVPNITTLIERLRHWAGALCDVCRLYAQKCLEIHLDSNAEDTAPRTVGILGDVLCSYLCVPRQKLFLESWPDDNGVRKFILEVVDAPIELREGELIMKPVLPRWEPTSRFARRIAGLSGLPRRDHFLSGDESRTALVGLEEVFRNALFGDLLTVYSQAVLLAPSIDPRSRLGRPLSEFDQLAGRLYDEALVQQIKHRVSEENLQDITKQIDDAGFLPIEHLEKRSREKLANHNKRYPRSALKTWLGLVKHPRFKSDVRHRLARAGDKYRNSRPE